MKRCPICESTYDDSVDFCFKDGAPLDASADEAPSKDASASAGVTASDLPEPTASGSFAGLDDDDLMPPDAVSLSNLPAVDPDKSMESLPTGSGAMDALDAGSLPAASALDADSSLDIAGIAVVRDVDPDATSDAVDPFAGEEAQLFRRRMVKEGVRKDELPAGETDPDATHEGEESAATQLLPPVSDRSADASADAPDAADAADEPASTDDPPSAKDAKAAGSKGKGSKGKGAKSKDSKSKDSDAPAPMPPLAKTAPPPPPKSSPGRPGPTISARRPEPKAKKGGFPIGLVAGVVVVGLVVFFLFGRGGDAPVEATPTPVATRATPTPAPAPPQPTGGEEQPGTDAAAQPDEPEVGGQEERGEDGSVADGSADEPAEAPTEPAEEPAVEEPPAEEPAAQTDPAAERRRREAEARRRQEQKERREAAAKAAREKAAREAAAKPSEPTLPFEANPQPTPAPARTPAPMPTPSGGVATADNPWGASQPAAKGSLNVSSTPAGAAVSVDGQSKGKTPANLSLTPGTHEVRIALAEHATQTRVVRVEEGGSSNLAVTLESLAPKAITGSLNVITPTPAQLSIDGVSRGRTPLTVTLPAGTHTFRLTVEGQPPHEETYNVQFDAAGKATKFFNVSAAN